MVPSLMNYNFDLLCNLIKKQACMSLRTICVKLSNQTSPSHMLCSTFCSHFVNALWRCSIATLSSRLRNTQLQLQPKRRWLRGYETRLFSPFATHCASWRNVYTLAARKQHFHTLGKIQMFSTCLPWSHPPGA